MSRDGTAQRRLDPNVPNSILFRPESMLGIELIELNDYRRWQEPKVIWIYFRNIQSFFNNILFVDLPKTSEFGIQV